MQEEIKGGRDRPNENAEVNNSYEFNSYYNTEVYNHVFGFDIFSVYSPEMISNMIRQPMVYNEELRKLSNELYSASGLLTQCIDYCTAMPTLDYVVIPRGRNKIKQRRNKDLMESALRTLKHKEFVRDALFKSMIDGVAFYYCETTAKKDDNKEFMHDWDVENILEINSLGVNISVIPLPTNYMKIVGRKNSAYVLAMNLRYFDEVITSDELERKLKLYPEEIRQGYKKWKDSKHNSGNWLVLDNTKTIVSKVRSRIEEAWGRPLCLAAIKNILYNSYFQDTCRGTLDEINNRIFYQEFPEGKDKGSCALTKNQQETQHALVKQGILNKNERQSASFFSVAAGTKIHHIDADTSLLDEKNSSYIQDQIGIDLGFMANLLSGTGSGSYAAQQNNLQLLLSEIIMWIEPITAELVKVINKHIIKDSANIIDLYYLPNSIITRSEFTKNMKELFLQGKGSLTAWIASTGVNAEAYLALMDHELEEDFENKYPVHQTSYTMSSSDGDNQGGRPTNDDSTNDSTLKSKANNANGLPSPSD